MTDTDGLLNDTPISLSLAVTNRAARSTIQLLSPESGDKLLEESDYRAEAKSLLRDLFGENGDADYYFHAQNGGRGSEGDAFINLWLIPSTDSPANARVLWSLNYWSLVLVGTSKSESYYGQREFLLIDLMVLPPWYVQSALDAYLPVQVKFVWYEPGNGFPESVRDQVQSLPTRRLNQNRVHMLLDDWERFLKINQGLAEAKSFTLDYSSYRLDSSGRNARFQVRFPKHFDRRKVHKAKGDTIHLDLTPPEDRIERAIVEANGEAFDDNSGRSEKIGEIRGLKGGWLEVELDELLFARIAKGHQILPEKGYLQYKVIGELAQIHRLQWGLKSLRRGRATNRRLGEFIFDAHEARQPDERSSIRLRREELLQPHLNEGQLRAVEGALNAPDLYLIQGPPGTGKTTVIAEICYQVAMRGGRTMVASQANLAVDHAMSKLVHHPSIRALRRGRAESVAEEGQPYIEEYAIGTWLDQVAQECESDLERRVHRTAELEELIRRKPEIEEYQGVRDAYRQRVAPLQRAVDDADRRRAEAAGVLEILQERKSRGLELEQFLNAFHTVVRSNEEGDFSTLNAPNLPIEMWAAALGPSASQDFDQLKGLVEQLKRWRGSTVDQSLSFLTEPPQGAYLLNYVECARAHVKEGSDVLTAVEESRPHIEALHSLGVKWYDLSRQMQPLLEQKTAMLNALSDGRADVERLKQNIEQHEMALRELRVLNRELAHLRPELHTWLRQRAESDITFPSVPHQFQAGVRREVWERAIAQVRFDDSGGSANPARDLKDDVEILGSMIDEIERCVAELLSHVSPAALQAAERRPPAWRETPLVNYVQQSNGVLHPVPEARHGISQLQTLLAAAKKGNLSEQQLARNIVGLRGMASDLRHSQAVLRREVEQQKLHMQKSMDRLMTQLLDQLRELVGKRENSLDQELHGLRRELVRTEYDLQFVETPDSDLEARLQELGIERSRIAHQIKTGLRNEASVPLIPVRSFAQRALDVMNMPEDAWHDIWQREIDGFNRMVVELRRAVMAIDVEKCVGTWRAESRSSLRTLQQKVASQSEKIRMLGQELLAARQSLREVEDENDAVQQRWHGLCDTLPETERLATVRVESDEFVTYLIERSRTWKSEKQELGDYLASYMDFVVDWIKRVKERDERDEEDLHQIYIDNANVIGITCSQAGSKSFSKRYRNFDVVIIDEVSKATPPELLLPMLKGEKVVLVGDSRQLPPMVGPRALTDMAESLKIDKRDLAHLERSLFRDLFERSPTELKSWLIDQYRMHPHIMDAINQFYNEKLVCRIETPERSRAHGLSPLIPDAVHIAWIPTKWTPSFYEVRDGTSRRNEAEVDIIANLVEQMDDVWSAHPADRPKELGVITFYAAQERALRSRLLGPSRDQKYEHLDLRLGTVDRFQGMEKPVIIVSLVCNNKRRDIGFARAFERINVAFSRAQELLVIVGCRELFCQEATATRATERYRNVAEVVRRNGGMLNVSDFIAH